MRFLGAPDVIHLGEVLQPNSVRLIAIEVLGQFDASDRALILSDLLELNPELFLERDVEDIFVAASTPSDFLTDVICEVAAQPLRRDPKVHAEDELRLALAGA
jgi:hypothetical protein